MPQQRPGGAKIKKLKKKKSFSLSHLSPSPSKHVCSRTVGRLWDVSVNLAWYPSLGQDSQTTREADNAQLQLGMIGEGAECLRAHGREPLTPPRQNILEGFLEEVIPGKLPEMVKVTVLY